jgi:hypothetical protein
MRPMSRSRHWSELVRSFRLIGDDGAARATGRFAVVDQEPFERRPREHARVRERGRRSLTADGVRIVVAAPRTDVIFPASVDEIRKALEALPVGVLDGLARIRLCDPRRDIAAVEADDERCDVDGVVGVLAPPALGLYRSWNAEILLFGYALIGPRRLNAEEHRRLRADFFDTLFHEVAHHADREDGRRGARVVLRGRRRAEDFAERTAEEWFQTLLDPGLAASLEHAESEYGVGDIARSALRAVFLRAAALAGAVLEWDRRAWIDCLIEAAEENGQNPFEVLAFAGGVLSPYLDGRPECRETRGSSVASFRAVADAFI